MMASLLHPTDAAKAVRVLDLELSDAFFVPFFSSLSFNTHGHTMTNPATQIDRQLRRPNYSVNMTAVLVGHTFLSLSTDAWAEADRKGTIIDSGTTLAYLAEGIYEPLVYKVDLMEFLKKSIYWQRSKGKDRAFPMTHLNAFRFLLKMLNESIQVVVDFCCYLKGMSNLNKDVVSPYVHVVDSFTNDESQNPQ